MANPKPPKTKIGILFEAHIEDLAPKTVRAGYDELRARLTAYTKALEKDANIIISDSYVCVNTSELLTAQVKSANTTAERLDSVVKVEKPEAAKPAKPAKPVKPASKVLAVESDQSGQPDSNEDPPHIVTMSLEELKREREEKAVQAQAPAPVAEKSHDELLGAAVAQLERKSAKTEALLAVLIRQKAPISPSDLALAAKMDKTDVSSWLSGTMKKYKFVKSVGRGQYEFDRTALPAQ